MYFLMRHVHQQQPLYNFHMICQSISSFEHLFFFLDFFIYRLDFSLNLSLEFKHLM